MYFTTHNKAIIVMALGAYLCVPAVIGKMGMIMEARLQNFYQCPNHRNTTMLIKDAYVKRISASERRLFGKLVLEEDVEDIKGRLEMYRCASKSEPDTCEYYTAIQYDSICYFLKHKKDPWYTYLNSTTMPMRCPMPKQDGIAQGTWEMQGIKIGLTSSFPLLNGFWRFKNKGYDSKKKLNSCFFMEMMVVSHFG